MARRWKFILLTVGRSPTGTVISKLEEEQQKHPLVSKEGGRHYSPRGDNFHQ